MENVSLNNKVIIYSPFHFKNTTITIESNKPFNSIKINWITSKSYSLKINV